MGIACRIATTGNFTFMLILQYYIITILQNAFFFAYFDFFVRSRGELPPVPDDLVAVDDVDAGRQALKGGGTKGTATDKLAGEGVDC